MTDIDGRGDTMPDEQSLDALLNASDNACAIIDRHYRYVWANTAYQRLHLGAPSDLSGRCVQDVLGGAFERVDRWRLDRCLAGEPQCYRTERHSPALGWRTLEVRHHPLNAPAAVVSQVGVVIADITQSRQNDHEIHKLMQVAHLNPAPIAITDAQGGIEYVNPAFEHNSGYRRDELLGDTLTCIKSGNTPDAVNREIWETVEAGGIWTGELESRRKDGEPYREYTLIAPLENEDRAIANYIAIKQDTTALRATEKRLERAALEDPLTGLPTRTGFSEALQEQLDGQGWPDNGVIAMVDIISLRDINDAYGYEGGDRLLIQFSQRLRSLAGEHGLSGRIGGDECTLYLPLAPDRSTVSQLEQLVEALSQPFDLNGVAIRLAIRLGYSHLGHTPRPAETLLQEAERALFRHRAESTLPWVAYSEALEAETQARVGLTQALRRALENDEFEVHFQPKVDMATGRVIAAEALLRWNHPTRGLVSPGVFIPIAEQSQLIGPIGEWTLRRACQHLKAWSDAGLDLVRVAVNVSLIQFRSGHFPDQVRRILDESGIEPQQLSLEITESVFASESTLLLEQLRALRAMNVRLSLDDFGTGYSSLLYLQHYPFDEIKIDQGFVADLMQRNFNRNLIDAVRRLAQALDAEIIAEGIEAADVRDELLAMGIQFGQGFYYSMPLEAEDFRWLLERRSHLPLTRGRTE
ncbi:EAL domain-containing protein [Spiribacter sp. 1M153]|uniref:putative bifunctional diguanylate cyclase/phosphodiesterase n=1 Tax=Spiribacter roseus TaxID=1855875 RepID=UPI00349F539A